MKKFNNNPDQEKPEIEERVVFINRCNKVVKGGRNFSFSAVVVAGDHKGRVGLGFGKAGEVAAAISKGSELARKNMINVTLDGNTIPHEVQAKYSGARVLMRPASAGTGLIAGGGMRAVLELAGVHDVLAKSLGSNNPNNVVKATLLAIKMLEGKDYVKAKRGLEII